MTRRKPRSDQMALCGDCRDPKAVHGPRGCHAKNCWSPFHLGRCKRFRVPPRPIEDLVGPDERPVKGYEEQTLW